MPDPNPLNDPELKRLERRLSRVTWSPTPAERERLLYACGQAAGRAQMMRPVRRAKAVAALLACACAGLGFVLLQRQQSPMAAINPVPTHPSKKSVTDPQRDFLPRERAEDAESAASARTHELSASANLADLALLERAPRIAESHGDIAKPGDQPVLRAGGPLAVEL
jgi:hypothetical protein